MFSKISGHRATHEAPMDRPKSMGSSLHSFPVMLGLLLVPTLSTWISAADAPTPAKPIPGLTEQQQNQANEEANAFNLSAVIDTNTSDAEEGDGTNATGVLPMTPEAEAERRKNSRVVKKIVLNKIGLARVNAERVKKNLKPLVAGKDVHVAPSGRDVVSEPEGAQPAPGAAPGEIAPEAATTLPTGVNNSTLKYFPPIRNQGSLGSCAQWAGIYYNMTHEMALVRDWNAKSGGDAYRMTPMFSYNFINGGQNVGSHSWDGWSIAQVHGIPRWSEFYTTSATTWCTNPSIYRSALADRVAGYSTIYDVNTQAGIDLLKAHLANGHTAVYYTYINSWVNKTISNDPSTTDDDALVGKTITYKVSGNKGGHAMTVLGYNDSVWCDINGNGVVDTGEKGAFRIANSWGTGWRESGYSWVAYQGLVTQNPSKGWTGDYGGVFQYNQVWFVNPLTTAHVPKVVARITLNHSLRNQVSARVGIGSVGSSTPASTISPKIVDYDGGGFAFSGAAATAQDFTYFLDVSDLTPSVGTAKRWFAQINDSGTGNGDLTIKKFELYYVNGGADTLVGVAANTPLVANGNAQYAWIDWTVGEIKPIVTWTTASQSSINESGTLTVTAQLSTTSTKTVSVPFTVSGTATNGSDYTISASPISIAAGATTGTATITIKGDSVYEVNESVILTIGAPTNAIPGAASVHTAIITDDDNTPPVVATAAKATPNPVTGKTTTLSVLGSDNAGEAALTYTWATAGTIPAAVTFSPNGTNAAKSTTATFAKAGLYNFQVTIKDAGNLSVTSSVAVTVSPTLTTVVVSPVSTTLALNETQTFTTTGKDQFGINLATQPTFSWSVDSGSVGTINAVTGVYSPNGLAGTATVRAMNGVVTGTATVTVANIMTASVGPSSKDRIVGETQLNSGTTALGYYANAGSGTVGNSGSSGSRTDTNIVIGYRLPTLPEGATVSDVTFKFEITAAMDGQNLNPNLDVYLLTTANPDTSGTSLYYHGASTTSTSAKLVGSTYINVGTSQASYADDQYDISFKLTGEALALVQSMYGGDNVPDQAEAFFRFNLSKDPAVGSSFVRYLIDTADHESALIFGYSPEAVAPAVPPGNG